MHTIFISAIADILHDLKKWGLTRANGIKTLQKIEDMVRFTHSAAHGSALLILWSSAASKRKISSSGEISRTLFESENDFRARPADMTAEDKTKRSRRMEISAQTGLCTTASDQVTLHPNQHLNNIATDSLMNTIKGGNIV
jgi:hypothetical protein